MVLCDLLEIDLEFSDSGSSMHVPCRYVFSCLKFLTIIVINNTLIIVDGVACFSFHTSAPYSIGMHLS